MIKEDNMSLKASSFAALALAFASFGDAFLYPFLPVNFDAVGIPMVWVGVLLSINRFVRIVSNTWIVHAFAKYGLRSIMILAVVLAITSTLGYGIATGVVALIFFRIMWGLAFSAMRIGTLGYALQHERVGFALGITRSLQESGPMIALMIAPFLLTYFQSPTIFYVLAALSIPALYFAFALPRGEDKTQSVVGTKVMQWPTTLNSITLVSAILIDGIVVVVLGVLFLHYRDNISLLTATSLAAFYLGYRRICLVVLSPAGGWIADRTGLDRVFNVSMALVTLGLIAILAGWIGTGAIIVFTFYSINSAVTPGSATSGKLHSLAAVAENATWRDIGAAIGTLLGGFLISSPHLNSIMLVSIFALVILLFIHLGSRGRVIKLFYLWK
jgi:MFS family permease